MDNITIESSDNTTSEIIINNSIKVTINAESFNETGEMIVDYDDAVVTKNEATDMVNEYFEKVLTMIKNNKLKEEIK